MRETDCRGLVLTGDVMLSKSLIQYSVDGSGRTIVFLSVVCPEA